MKKITKKIVTAGLAASLMVGSAANAFATGLTFSDVPTSFWGYNAIMAMVERGVFSGATTPVNGVGTFSPNADMTRAAYIKTMVAYLYPDEVKPAAAGESWYAPYVAVAKSKGLIADGEIGDDMNVAMPRQEMAMLSVRAAAAQGETATQLIDISKIPDYNSVDDYYKNYVREAITLGLIAGVDTAGTFAPKAGLNRASAATVAYRLIDKNVRAKVDFSNASDAPAAPVTTPEVKTAETRLVAGAYSTQNTELRPTSKASKSMTVGEVKANLNETIPKIV